MVENYKKQARKIIFVLTNMGLQQYIDGIIIKLQTIAKEEKELTIIISAKAKHETQDKIKF